MKPASREAGRSFPGAATPDEPLPMQTPQYWEEVFAQEDPWNYGHSGYEKWKFAQTLSLLPKGRIARALELACAEGHLTALLAPRVGRLTAIDISPTAVKRARVRCKKLDNVEFQVLDLIKGVLPSKLDLILCSEVLFYLPRDILDGVAAKLAAAIRPGGHILLAHGNLITDDRTKTGFDWGHPFGAKTIGDVFRVTKELMLVKELRTPLYTVQLFRRVAGRHDKRTKARFLEIPIPADLELPLEVERGIIWDGAVTTRDEARERETAAEVPILMYHSIADDGPEELKPYRVTPRAFTEQLRYLRRLGFHSITLDEWASSIVTRKPLAGRPIILTFDDGYKNFFDNAWPALQRADFSATVFVVTDKVGGAADWDEVASQPLRLMDWSELRTLSANGITIASHSASHKDLTAISAAMVCSEGARARGTLQEKLGIEVKAIAFPWGRGDEAVRRELATCGYTIGLTTWGGPSTLADDPLNLPRIEICYDDGIEELAAKLQRRAKPVDIVADRKDEISAKHPVGFSAEQLREARGNNNPVHPDYGQALARRLDALIGEFVMLQTQLLKCVGSPVTLQRRLTTLFSQPVTGRTSRQIKSGDEISPGIAVTFDPSAQLTFSVEPKVDHSLSPNDHLNVVSLNFTGSSEWLALEVSLDWNDLSLAQHFQLCLYARPSRWVECEAAIRFPRKPQDSLETTFTTFELSGDDRNAVVSGDLTMPDFIDLDTTRKPQLLFFFSSESDLSIAIHYLNVYFA